MGKPTGFIDYSRVECPNRPVAERIGDYAEFHGMLRENERREQAGRCMNCGVPFCQTPRTIDKAGSKTLVGCPLRNLIPEWNDLIWADNLQLALSRLTKTNCFPEFTGRVCPALCERECACCDSSDGAVTIRDNELAIIEAAWKQGLVSPHVPSTRSGYSVAVVGSGPAGLACAYWLNRRGHAVTVFERDARPGGLLTYGIPTMKLPQEVIDRRVANMESEGIVFEVNAEIVELDDLKARFDCVVLCCGAQKPRPVPFENDGLSGIVYALDYLRDNVRHQLGEAPLELSANGKHVVIIGNGDTATDCVGTAIRQGCASVTQVIRKPESYYAPELDYAHVEALEVFGEIRRFETRVVAAQGEKAVQSVTLATPDGEASIPCDLLVIASGFTGCDDVAANLGGQVDASEGVFVAGDMAHGASLVVRALADAREVSARVDRHLTGFTSIL